MYVCMYIIYVLFIRVLHYVIRVNHVNLTLKRNKPKLLVLFYIVTYKQQVNTRILIFALSALPHSFFSQILVSYRDQCQSQPQ